jgi:hypothetical protein
MTFAAAYEDEPRVWGVGRVVVDGEVVPWPVAADDIADEAEAMAPRLAALGLAAGGLVLIVSMLSEAIHVVPIERAAGKVGALYSSADATAADAFRVAALVRQLEPHVVMGVNRDVVDGLAELGHDPADVLGAVDAVVTTGDDAYVRLRAAGLDPRRWVKLGPTSAIEGLDGEGPVYDETRWFVEADDGELLVTARASRLTPANRLRSGVRGRVDGNRIMLAI